MPNPFNAGNLATYQSPIQHGQMPQATVNQAMAVMAPRPPAAGAFGSNPALRGQFGGLMAQQGRSMQNDFTRQAMPAVNQMNQNYWRSVMQDQAGGVNSLLDQQQANQSYDLGQRQYQSQLSQLIGQLLGHIGGLTG